MIALACRNLPPNQRKWGVNCGALVFSLVLSVPLVIGGSQFIMRMIERFPLLVVAGGGLLGYVAAGMMITDPVVADWVKAQGAWLQWTAPIAGILVVIGLAYWLKRRQSDTASNEVFQ